MTVEDARARIERIRECQRDAEVAHGLEDLLHSAFIAFIAAEAPEPFSSVAREVLKVEDLDFPRWCA